MKNLITLIFLLTILSSCTSNNFEFIEYRAKHEEFSKVYGETVYKKIEFGNNLNPNAVIAIICDEKGWNIIGKLTDGALGLASIIEGTYTIKDNYVIINWKDSNTLDLPNKLKIENSFSDSKLNTTVKNLIDEKSSEVYEFNNAWNFGDKK
jgi:regulator of extracellular matrix RemA (YlzA/DUF370 family)